MDDEKPDTRVLVAEWTRTALYGAGIALAIGLALMIKASRKYPPGSGDD